MLKEETYKEYLVRELSILQFLPIIELGDQNFQQMRLKLLSMSLCDPVTKEPIGEAGLSDVGASQLKDIWRIVATMHGLINEVTEEKKSDE